VISAPEPILDRVLDPLRDHRVVLGTVESHGPVESLRPGDQHPSATSKGIRGDPGFVGLGQIPAGGGYGAIDSSARGSGNPELQHLEC
jgi:hypothetical protein